MSNVAISALTNVTSVGANDLYPTVQSSVTYNAKASQIAAFVLGSATTTIGTGGAAALLASNGAYNLTLVPNGSTSSNSSITINQGTNGNILLTPNGTGSILLGSGAANVTAGSSGAYNLVLTTNVGASNQGTITIANGANGNITVAPNGTGVTAVSSAMTVAGNTAVTGNVSATGSILTSSSSGGIGYATGSGATVTQGTSRTTPVTINSPNGQITMFSAAGSATAAQFSVSNSSVAANDMVHINVKSGATNIYNVFVSAVSTGSFTVTFYTTGGTSTDAPVLQYSIIKGTTS
jgi:hypothetical protein